MDIRLAALLVCGGVVIGGASRPAISVIEQPDGNSSDLIREMERQRGTTPAPAPAPAPAMDEAARAAMLASLARIEAQLAEARQGPVVGPNAQLIARFEELDSRVSAQVAQIAQQLVEVAQLARAAARAPAPAPAPAALIDAPRPLPSRPPRRLAARADLAAAIRDLRASLDAGPGLGGAA